MHFFGAPSPKSFRVIAASWSWPPQEFATLTPNNLVFKLVGPVLVKQDQAEAKSNVDKRLEFIRGEMCAYFSGYHR
jgi:prefoldin subunit